jgi:hypothetical protein
VAVRGSDCGPVEVSVKPLHLLPFPGTSVYHAQVAWTKGLTAAIPEEYK